jgi:uncharacterized protein (DUF433 family)
MNENATVGGCGMKGEKTGSNPNLTEKDDIIELAKVFEFISPKTIRIKGTRVGIEIVIEKFLDSASPEEIRRHHPHLTLKQIYATITYYLFNQERIDAYIKAGRKRVEAAYEEQRKNPSSGVKRLIKIKAQREASRLQVREETQ